MKYAFKCLYWERHEPMPSSAVHKRNNLVSPKNWVYFLDIGLNVQRICIWRGKIQMKCQLASCNTLFPFLHNILLKLKCYNRRFYLDPESNHSPRTPTGFAPHCNHVSCNTHFLIQTSWEPLKQANENWANAPVQYIMKG